MRITVPQDSKMMTKKLQSGAPLSLLGLILAASVAVHGADAKLVKQLRYEVGADASVSVYNQYGPITVHSANTNVITVKATLGSDKVEVDPLQNGSHVELRSHMLPGATAANAQVSYELTVPYGTELNLRSSTGPLKVEKLGADVTLEGDSASVDVRDIVGAHVHVRTLDGDVTLTDIQQGHVEVMTVGGSVFLRSVGGPLVKVETTSGLIRYAGQFTHWKLRVAYVFRQHRTDAAAGCVGKFDRRIGLGECYVGSSDSRTRPFDFQLRGCRERNLDWHSSA